MSTSGGHSEDLGPLLLLPCCGCDATQWFQLRHHTAYFRVLWLKFGKTSAYSVHCSKCDFTIDIPKHDVTKVIKFLPLARSFASGRISQADFLGRLAEMDFAFLKEYANANTQWTCPKCGEESPYTFPSCWSCGTVREDTPQNPEKAGPNIPYLDQALGNKGGPFGTMGL